MFELEEKKIYLIQLQEISIEFVCKYYAEIENRDTILVIFSRTKYITNISYDEVSRCCEEKELMYYLNYIYRNKCVDNCKSMYEQAKLIFERNHHISYILLRDSIHSGKAFFYHSVLDTGKYQEAMRYVRQVLKEKGIHTYMVRIPDISEIDEEKRHEEWRFGYFSAPINWTKTREKVVKEYLYNFTEYGYDDAKKNIIHKKEMMYGEKEKTVFLVGPCIVAEWENCAGESLPAILQEYLFYSDIQYKIKKVVVEEDMNAKLNAILEYDIRKNDIVIWITDCMDKSMADLDLTDLYNQYEGDRWLYADVPIHTTKVGNEKIAGMLIRNIIRPVSEKLDEINSQTLLHAGETQLTVKEQEKLFLYIEEIKRSMCRRQGTIGACVMTCNPFTKGHYHLIDYASRQVDLLYVFVVEEDAFLFSFVDRIEMVRRGTAELRNVVVLPGGDFIISKVTFKNYFEKEIHSHVTIDAEKDVMIFKNYIAPALNITKRFVGEEQTDPITAQYNRLLRKKMDVLDVIEIPREKIDDEIISASKVRKYMEDGNWAKIEKMVPRTTFEYLIARLAMLRKVRKREGEGGGYRFTGAIYSIV